MFDIAIQAYGDAAQAVAVAIENDLSFDVPLVEGLELSTTTGELAEGDLVRNFTRAKFAPNNAADVDADRLEGINYWGIEIDFIVQ